jgi:hypothetical protein
VEELCRRLIYVVCTPNFFGSLDSPQRYDPFVLAIPLVYQPADDDSTHTWLQHRQFWKPAGSTPVRLSFETQQRLQGSATILIRRDAPFYAWTLHAKHHQGDWEELCSMHVKAPQIHDGLDSDLYFTISVASFPRVESRRLDIHEVFPADRWRPTPKTLIFGTRHTKQHGVPAL